MHSVLHKLESAGILKSSGVIFHKIWREIYSYVISSKPEISYSIFNDIEWYCLLLCLHLTILNINS